MKNGLIIYQVQKKMKNEICSLCHKETYGLTEVMGELYCEECRKQVEREMDAFDLLGIWQRQGSVWIKNRLQTFKGQNKN